MQERLRPLLHSFTKSKKELPRIPPVVAGIQYNICKNPKCCNFGVALIDDAEPGEVGNYRRVGGGKGYGLPLHPSYAIILSLLKREIAAYGFTKAHSQN